VCAEENDVLARLAATGSRMRYDPGLLCFHERRDSWRGFARQMHKYGRGRGQVMSRRRHVARPGYLAPAALVGYTATLPLTWWCWRGRALAPAAAYGAVIGAGAVRIAATLRRPQEVGRAAAMLAAIHVGHGTGVWRGLLEPRREVAPPEVLGWTGPICAPVDAAVS
jgi:hypothetical protein